MPPLLDVSPRRKHKAESDPIVELSESSKQSLRKVLKGIVARHPSDRKRKVKTISPFIKSTECEDVAEIMQRLQQKSTYLLERLPHIDWPEQLWARQLGFLPLSEKEALKVKERPSNKIPLSRQLRMDVNTRPAILGFIPTEATIDKCVQSAEIALKPYFYGNTSFSGFKSSQYLDAWKEQDTIQACGKTYKISAYDIAIAKEDWKKNDLHSLQWDTEVVPEGWDVQEYLEYMRGLAEQEGYTKKPRGLCLAITRAVTGIDFILRKKYYLDLEAEGKKPYKFKSRAPNFQAAIDPVIALLMTDSRMQFRSYDDESEVLRPPLKFDEDPKKDWSRLFGKMDYLLKLMEIQCPSDYIELSEQRKKLPFDFDGIDLEASRIQSSTSRYEAMSQQYLDQRKEVLEAAIVARAVAKEEATKSKKPPRRPVNYYVRLFGLEDKIVESPETKRKNLWIRQEELVQETQVVWDSVDYTFWSMVNIHGYRKTLQMVRELPRDHPWYILVRGQLGKIAREQRMI